MTLSPEYDLFNNLHPSLQFNKARRFVEVMSHLLLRLALFVFSC